MAVNDLTTPLGQGQTKRQDLTKIPVAPIIAVTLGLLLGVFVLWAIVVDEPAGGEPVAVAPADLRIPKKGPERIAVPQAAVPVGAPQAASQAGLQREVLPGGLEPLPAAPDRLCPTRNLGFSRRSTRGG